MAAAGVPDLEAVPAQHRDQGGGDAVVVLDQEQAHRAPSCGVRRDAFGPVARSPSAGGRHGAGPTRNRAILASTPIRRLQVNRIDRSVTAPVFAVHDYPA
ncbi:hypothetical protein GCM10010195_43890 [Kitasatospora griseola]|nr:hypothetical protein GCM10010195_43890 [Kitasatospora griseola]